MRDGWAETTLGQYIHINTGKLDVNAASEFGEYPFFTCSRETYRINEAAFEGESVLVAGNGDLNVKYYDGEFNAYQRTYVLNSVDKKILDNRFLFLYMQTYIEYLRSETRGTVIQYLKKGQFTDAKIKLPPLSEQKRIIDLISSVDAALGIYSNYLVSCQNLQKAIASETFQDQEIMTSKLGDHCSPKDIQIGPFGSQLHASDYLPEGIPVVMPQDIIKGKISTARIVQISALKAKELSRHRLFAGDILFARRGDLTKRAIVSKNEEGWICGTGTVRVRSAMLHPQILFHAVTTDEVNTWLLSNAVGATMPNLNTELVKNIPIRVPSNVEDKLLVLDELDQNIVQSKVLTERLEILRFALLSDLFSGEHVIPANYDNCIGAA